MIRVLLADDHALLRQGLTRLLREAGDIEVVAECGDGVAALELIRSHSPDVAVLDVTMPRLDGISVARQVALEMPSTRVIILTMHNDRDVFERAAEAKVYGYVLKGDAFEELLDTIRVVYRMTPITSAPRSRSARKTSLTNREKQVLQLIASGCTNRIIAADLGISIKTVDNHRTNLMNKLGLHSTAELVRYALKSGLV